MEVSLLDILDSREKRAQRQQQLLGEFAVPLLSFTMNIAGPVKTDPLIQRGFRAGLAMLENRLPEECILHREISTAFTGCEAIYAVAMDAGELKALCTAIEESCAMGRLFDMDVLDENSKKLERATLRSCMVCGAPGRACAAGRLHTVEQLQTVTGNLLREHFALADRQWFADAAVQCLIDEVEITPKPGLVDRRNSGSHADMDTSHFIASANALRPYFDRCVGLGQQTAHLPPEQTFPLLRSAGLEAEKAMYAATGGVNTHKGAIYTLGVLCGALGRLWTPETPVAPLDQIFSQCAQLVEESVSADFAAMTGATAGERLYLHQGLKGIRGEVAAGLPGVANIGLRVFQKGLQNGLSANHAGAVTLLHLIAGVEDTNLHHRGGREGAAWAKDTVRALLQAAPYPDMKQLEQLDDAFIARRLSPGGCADLLAATCFLHSLSL